MSKTGALETTGRPASIEGKTSWLGRYLPLPRLVGQLWGTTTLGDCLAAMGYLASVHRLVRGPSVTQFEQAFARQTGTRYAISLSSGRVALYGLLRSLGIGAGDEVLLQVPTHIVVANAIRYTGARPVYVDCRLDSYNMDLEQAEQKVTVRTRVLLVQHTFGIPVDMKAALALARRHRLLLIEDCVHALGAAYDGRSLGSFGIAAFFSTEETKTISSTMGGMAVTSDSALAARLRDFQAGCAWPSRLLVARHILKLVVYHFCAHPYILPYTRPVYLFLRRSPWTYLAPGATGSDEKRGLRPSNYEQRLSNAQAALALRQLRRLEANLAHRRSVAEAYRVLLTEHGFAVPCPPPQGAPAYVRYPVWVEDRAKAMSFTASCAVLGQWFNSVLEESASPSHGDYQPGSCPNAEAAAQHLVNLPTHPRVRAQDIQAIVSVLVRASASRGG